eukprot:scaffold27604_cov141-Isochrysis_galbana.AAC.4
MSVPLLAPVSTYIDLESSSIDIQAKAHHIEIVCFSVHPAIFIILRLSCREAMFAVTPRLLHRRACHTAAEAGQYVMFPGIVSFALFVAKNSHHHHQALLSVQGTIRPAMFIIQAALALNAGPRAGVGTTPRAGPVTADSQRPKEFCYGLPVSCTPAPFALTIREGIACSTLCARTRCVDHLYCRTPCRATPLRWATSTH